MVKGAKMIRVRAEKLSANEDTYNTDLKNVSFIAELPKPGKSMMLMTSKLHGGVLTSIVEDFSFIANDEKVVYSVQTLNSIYKITILNEDLEGEI